jgi:hypothetical protein
MTSATAFQRTPLVIAAGNLVAGPVHATFRDGDRESLLHSYLVLVRQLRGQHREPSITLRSDDISAIADHLGVSEERVLDDLLVRMGATRAQRKALFAMFTLGALSIVATGSVALDLAPPGALAQESSGVAVVIETVDVPAPPTSQVAGISVVDAAPVAADAMPSDAMPADAMPADAMPADAMPAELFLEPELVIAAGGAEWELMVSLQQLSHALSTQPAVSLPQPVADLGVGPVEVVDLAANAREVEDVGVGVGVADDGSVVAVAEPPLPTMPEGVGVADDGSVVAVGQPPLP